MGRPPQPSIAACDNSLSSDMATVLATVAANSGKSSDREQLERVNKWFEVALNNMARGLSMFDAEQRLIVCNKLYRDIYDLPEELTRPGTPLAEIVQRHRWGPRLYRQRPYDRRLRARCGTGRIWQLGCDDVHRQSRWRCVSKGPRSRYFGPRRGNDNLQPRFDVVGGEERIGSGRDSFYPYRARVGCNRWENAHVPDRDEN